MFIRATGECYYHWLHYYTDYTDYTSIGIGIGAPHTIGGLN